MTEETKPTKAPEKVIQQLVKLTKSMSPEDQELLGQLGFIIPTGDIESALKGEYKLGYRCPYCNDVALYFVGSSWPSGQEIELKDGRVEAVPPLHVPIDHIAWTQTGRKASDIDRHNPTCQSCNGAVQLGFGRRLRVKLIVHIKRFVGARDLSYDRRKIRDLQRETAGPEAVSGFTRTTEPSGRVKWIHWLCFQSTALIFL